MPDKDRDKARPARELLDILNDDGLDLQIEAAYHRAYFEQRMLEQFIWDRRDSAPNP